MLQGSIARQTSTPPTVSLARRAYQVRRNALLMAQAQGEGPIGPALGIADILAVSYFHAMRYCADAPQWDGRDRFVLSAGHYALALYAVLIEAGVLPEAERATYGQDGSRLPVVGMERTTPGIEMSAGAPGLGLGVAVGTAMGLRRRRNPATVYALIAGGEADEGATCEAAMAAAQHGLGNLVGLIDVGGAAATGGGDALRTAEALTARWAAFGWQCQRVDGNDIDALTAAFDTLRDGPGDQPRALVCDTRPCRGVPFLEARPQRHFMRVEGQEWARAIELLDAGRPS